MGDRLIFLDFDGVLNSAAWFTGGRPERYEAPDEVLAIDGGLAVKGWRDLDPDAVSRLQRIIDATDARIVVSSTWRLLYSLDTLRALLAIRGLRAEVIGCTPDLTRTKGALWEAVPRRDEIRAWLDGFPEPVESFVVLDDDRDASIDGHFVRTDWQTGLTDEHVGRAIALLSEAPRG